MSHPNTNFRFLTPPAALKKEYIQERAPLPSTEIALRQRLCRKTPIAIFGPRPPRLLIVEVFGVVQRQETTSLLPSIRQNMFEVHRKKRQRVAAQDPRASASQRSVLGHPRPPLPKYRQ